MSASVLYMSMSLDGYVAGPNDSPSNPGGDGFMRLHDWYGFPPGGPKGPLSGVALSSPHGQHFLDEILAIGAVVAGRRTVEQVDHWAAIITAPRSSSLATGRPALPSRGIRA